MMKNLQGIYSISLEANHCFHFISSSHQDETFARCNCTEVRLGGERSKLSHFLAVTQRPLASYSLISSCSWTATLIYSLPKRHLLILPTLSFSYPPILPPTVYPHSSTVPQNGLFLYYRLLQPPSPPLRLPTIIELRPFLTKPYTTYSCSHLPCLSFCRAK